MRPWPSTTGKGAIRDAADKLLGLGLSGALVALPVLTGALLAVLGTDLLVALWAIVGGMIAGWLAMTVFIVIGMGLFSDTDRPRAERLFGTLMVVVPPFVATGATLLCAQLLAGVSRPLLGVALLVLGLVAGITAAIAFVRRSAGVAVRDAKWLRDREAASSSDPEFAEQLRTEGWRVDGPYNEMRAAYFRAWERVKEARRASGRPIWRSSGDPVERPHDET